MPWRIQRRRQQQHGSENGGVLLYHQTSPEKAQLILQDGCMKPGPPGYGGSGIYFAPDPQATTCKANHKGVVLEAVVQLGRVRHVGRAGNWGSRLRQRLLRYDSVALTFLEGGIEYVVYDSSRVSSIRIHKVLHPCSSSGGISVDSSGSGSFQIGTAADPGGDGSSGSSSCSGHSAELSPGSSSADSVCSEQQLGPTATGLTDASCSSSHGALSAADGSRQCCEQDGAEEDPRGVAAHSQPCQCCSSSHSGGCEEQLRHQQLQPQQQQPCHHGPVQQQQPTAARQETHEQLQQQREQQQCAVSTHKSLSHMLVLVSEAMQAAGTSSGKAMANNSNSSLHSCKQLAVA